MSYQPRVPLPAEGTVDGVPSLPAVLAHYLPEVAGVRNGFNEALAHGSVDARTKELVRLYNAAVVDCAYCKNVRYDGGGGNALVAEDEIADLHRFESTDLPEAAKVALRLARTFFLAPHEVSADLSASLHEHYTDEQIVELLVHLVRVRAGSKTLVTLGLEPRDMPVTVI